MSHYVVTLILGPIIVVLTMLSISWAVSKLTDWGIGLALFLILFMLVGLSVSIGAGFQDFLEGGFTDVSP